MARLFLSHSSKDADLATELCKRLESRGVSCFMAPRDITLGRPYSEECVRGVESSDALVLIATPSSVSSVQVLSEIEQAHKRQKPIYTLMIGKPSVSRELDFYISRLHWIQFVPGSLDAVSTALVEAIDGKRAWSDVATGPSIARRVRYRRDLFVGATLAAVLTTAALVASAAYFIVHARDALNHDYRSLGFVSVSVSGTGNGASSLDGQLQVWISDSGAHFSDVRVLTKTIGRDGAETLADHSASLTPSGAGQMQFVTFSMPADVKQLTSCLTVPSAALGGRYRITQQFAVTPAAAAGAVGPAATPISQATVTQEDGRPCGAL